MDDRSSEWPPVSTSEVVAALRAAGLDVSSAARIHDGISSWTFDVDDGRYVARFPRTRWVAMGHERERRLLPALAAHVSFRVPAPLPVGEGFVVYERLPGRSLRADDDMAAVRAMIAELHSFPVADAHSLLEGALSWAERMRHHRATLTAAVWSRLSADERDALDAAWDAHDATLDDVELCLVHADLFPEHVLVDDATGRPVGMIDFEDASVGDPASDHAGLLHHLDVAPPATLARRAWFAAVEVDLWEIANADDTSVEVHLAALRRRLATGPR